MTNPTSHMTAGQCMPLVDIGLNLTHDSFDVDLEAVIQRALDVGVTRMLITGASMLGNESARVLARRYPQLMRCTAGVHPHHASELDAAALDSLQSMVRHPEVLAVGECGLDYFRNFSPREAQLQAFHQQLALAVQVAKPVFLHQRDAHEDFVAVLREHRANLAGGVAHCFTAGLDEAREYLDMGLYIGITGWICDERRGQHLREVVRYIPADRLLIETDAPYLLPRDLKPVPRSRRNEPMYLPHVLASIAKAREEDIQTVAASTTANALRLFNWPAEDAT